MSVPFLLVAIVNLVSLLKSSTMYHRTTRQTPAILMPVTLAQLLGGPATPLLITLAEMPDSLAITLCPTPGNVCATVHVDPDVPGGPTLSEVQGAAPAEAWHHPPLNTNLTGEYEACGFGALFAGRSDLRVCPDFHRPLIRLKVHRTQGRSTQVEFPVRRLQNGGLQIALSAAESQQVKDWCATKPSATDAMMCLLFAMLFTTIGEDE
ncbi:hypothetical protein C8R43DRAFT_1102260 [Mycena crocata]|nr:hypothetical protein C8R43DRAFT_1102260 [Mycena crocata]